MNYVTIYEEYKHKFFQLPKVFFTNEKYLNMSNNAKIAWSLLRDRSSLSRKNEWFDKDTGRIYFIYTNKDLMKILNIKSETTITNIRKELKKAELIEEKALGFNQPKKIYLIYPEINENDIYEIDNLENYEYEKKAKKEAQSHTSQGLLKNGTPKNDSPEPQKMGSINTDSSNTDLKDLDTIDTIDTKNSSKTKTVGNFSDKEKEKLKEQYIKRAHLNNDEKIPKELAKVLNIFSNTVDQANEYYKIIMIAVDKVRKDYDELLYLENEPELLQKISDAFIRAVRIKEKQGNISNVNGYLYNTIYSTIENELQDRALNRLRMRCDTAENENEYIKTFRALLEGKDL